MTRVRRKVKLATATPPPPPPTAAFAQSCKEFGIRSHLDVDAAMVLMNKIMTTCWQLICEAAFEMPPWGECEAAQAEMQLLRPVT